MVDLWPEQLESRGMAGDDKSSGEAPGRAQFKIPRKQGQGALVANGTFLFLTCQP